MFDVVNNPIVLKQLKEKNYLIEDVNVDSDICCIYFSSHGIYYPETENNFIDTIINKDVFEWYKSRMPNAKRHIFIRDIRKSFYVEGINSELNTIDKLIGFLRVQTNGFKVVTVGSSAGGYMAYICGGHFLPIKF